MNFLRNFFHRHCQKEIEELKKELKDVLDEKENNDLESLIKENHRLRDLMCSQRYEINRLHKCLGENCPAHQNQIDELLKLNKSLQEELNKK